MRLGYRYNLIRFITRKAADLTPQELLELMELITRYQREISEEMKERGI